MRTIVTETVAYTFAELSEAAKKKAVQNLFDINIDNEWWESTYDAAASIGLKITAFDIDRGNYCHGHLEWNAERVAAAILKEHGETCETHKTALAFLAELAEHKAKALMEYEKHLESLAGEESKYDDFEEYYHYETDEGEEVKEDFEKSLLKDYHIILQKEYEYLTSEEAIIETIEANLYEFDENGEII